MYDIDPLWTRSVKSLKVYLYLSFSNLGKAIIHVIGYGLLSVGTSKLLLQALESQKFNVVILDESHYLKTRKAARTKRLHQLCKKAKHAILLSGTPSLARPREVSDFTKVYTISRLLLGDTFSNYIKLIIYV